MVYLYVMKIVYRKGEWGEDNEIFLFIRKNIGLNIKIKMLVA